MPERPNGAVSKTAVSSNGHRGFKSHSLRHALVRGAHPDRVLPEGIESQPDLDALTTFDVT